MNWPGLNWLMLIAVGAGILSALAYLLRRRWPDALLAMAAGVALAGIAGGFSVPGEAGSVLTISASNPPATLEGVRSLRLEGDGLRAAEWDDLPARPLAWTPPATPAIHLAFPRELALGRMFTLSVQRSWRAPGRLQLLAENQQVLAEAKGEGELTVQWLPPLAENLVLTARLLDAGGKIVDQGPVPVRVREPLPLQVRGRFGAPSFDLLTLDELLARSNAAVDWKVELGKGVERAETARDTMQAPDLEIVDAAWFEHAGAAERAAVLARVAAGERLLVLGANANNAGLWGQGLGLALAPQPASSTAGGPLAMTPASLAPKAARAGEWQGEDGLWTREWQQGRIGWLGVGDWHRHAIEQPRALALWWQGVLDRLDLRRSRDLAWLDPDEMPLPQRRLAVCARGGAPAQSTGLTVPALKQTLAWQRRPEQVDAACAALWPDKSGWLRVQAQGVKSGQGELYVYADGDWPLWQRAQRRDATLRYAARTPALPDERTAQRPLPAWPFGIMFALAMLGLWWRERH